MAKRNGKSLVIVESPAKARTLSNILGRDYVVRASVGHIRDLPKSKLGVDVEKGFSPHYIVPKDKKKVVQELQSAVKQAGIIYLATDPDREGEAIAWHLKEATGLSDDSYKRAVFHEITPKAIQEAFLHPRDIDMQLVDAQQARRILDRLLGYKLSPLLWQKIRRGLSAGRVQSVALRLVVEREREIEAFVSQEYWTIEAELNKEGEDLLFRAKLVGLAGTRKKLEIGSEEQSQSLIVQLTDAAYQITDLKSRTYNRHPSPPFTTSTLQQEASRRFRFTPKRTMALAQQLYEGIALGSGNEVGLITYMRTDSTSVAAEAIEETRAYIADKIGKDFVPEKPQFYRKKAKGAQEAHEAIRPTSINRTPDSVRRHLTPDQNKLYSLVWQRMVASQMANALYETKTADIEARPQSGRDVYLWRATDTQLKFAGYRQLYIEGTDSDEQQSTNPLPELTVGDALRLQQLYPDQHFTEPPPRYNEATLIKALEANGIGRPSTYAPILATIQDRGYVQKVEARLQPTELGYVVNDLLIDNFPDLVNVDFTAQLEEELDDIASGERPWQPVVQEYYRPLEKALVDAEKKIEVVIEETEQVCEKCGRPMIIRWGRHGRFFACSGFPECRNTRPLEGEAEQLEQATEPCPECGATMVIKRGRFGPFMACSRYPDCKGTRPILDKVGVDCPLCGGDIVARKGRRGRLFYGCSNYPTCNFSVWAKPLPQPCPQCGGLLLNDGQSRARCHNCDWKGKTSEQEPVKAAS